MGLPSILPKAAKVDSDFWVEAAQGVIRRHCGWHVAPSITECIRLDSFGEHAVMLPTKHITELLKVIASGVDVTDCVEWSASGAIRARSGWPEGLGSIEITMTHGYDPSEVPEIQALIVTLARRAATGPGVIASQSTNGSSITYQTAGGAPLSIPLLEIEKEVLAPYKLNWGPQ